MIGAYGEWAARLAGDPPRLSFRRRDGAGVEDWRARARKRFRQLLLQPEAGPAPTATLVGEERLEGLVIEHLEWRLGYGGPTAALLLRPEGAREPLPGVLALHDHSGDKYFGLDKITRTGNRRHPRMEHHQELYYGGAAWANELARRGYAVLVHDAFAFGSRRIEAGEVSAAARGEWEQDIDSYNRFAAGHEHILAKSLLAAGTTWPGVWTWEDERALDYLCSRSDVDATRIGCCGLSGGGLRGAYLTALDERIGCCCCAGMMTTWRDYLLNTCHTHTWMIYVPGLALELDYPEILALGVPKPVLALSNREDPLFTGPEMERAHGMLAQVYEKAGAGERCQTKFYPGPHKFDLEMQRDAFGWLDRWLRHGGRATRRSPGSAVRE